MEYSEVKKYAQVYNTQALFQKVQEESLSNAVSDGIRRIGGVRESVRRRT